MVSQAQRFGHFGGFAQWGFLESTSQRHRTTSPQHLSARRDRFLLGGESGLKSREADVDDDEEWRLKSVVVTVSAKGGTSERKLFASRTVSLRFWNSKA